MFKIYVKKKNNVGPMQILQEKMKARATANNENHILKENRKKMTENEGERLTPESKDKMQDTRKA